MLFKLKDKIVDKLGVFGYILFYMISVAVYVIPFMFIDCHYLLKGFFIMIQTVVPFADLVFWIWGLVCAIQGVQDVFAIVYYVIFAAYVLPEAIALISAMFSRK